MRSNLFTLVAKGLRKNYPPGAGWSKPIQKFPSSGGSKFGPESGKPILNWKAAKDNMKVKLNFILLARQRQKF